MGARYLITGVQLGMMIGMPEREDRQRLAETIEEEQFIGISGEDVKKEAKCYRHAWDKKELAEQKKSSQSE